MTETVRQCLELKSCSFPSWYPKFSKITFKSIRIPIPTNVLKYILDDVFVLPKECNATSTTDEAQSNAAGSSDNKEWESEDVEIEQPEFPEFSAEIKRSIELLGGSVFMKTNWRSPKDAFWITAGQTMCCKDLQDIYQILKASNICREDLRCFDLPVFQLNADAETAEQMLVAQDGTSRLQDRTKPTDLYLVLRKWHDIHPGTEFRCFVKSRNLVGISPRDWPEYHEHIATQRVDIVKDIVSFYKEHIISKFPLFDYAFDVIRDSKDNVTLVDFSPLDEKYVDTLAFEWSDLNHFSEIIVPEEERNDPELRYLDTNCGILPNKRNTYGIPLDIIDFFRQTNSSTDGETSDGPNTLNDIIDNHLENLFINQPDANETDGQ